MTNFSGTEMLRFAVQMEVNGQGFYTAAAARMKDPAAREMLKELARQETEHRATFERMLAERRDVLDVAETVDDEYSLYLRAFVESQVFTDRRMKEILGRAELSTAEALQFGIDSERDAILYYTDVKDLVPASDHDALDRIIAEERDHYIRLVEMLRAA